MHRARDERRKTVTLLLIIGLVLLVLLFLGIPVAFSLAGLGVTLLYLRDLPLVMIAQNLHGALDNFVLLSVPLFLLMSNFLLKGGVGKDLFDAVHKWAGHLPGGLGLSALVSCGIFSAISGSSVATAATVGTVAIPEMISRGYSRHFTLGLLAAGGTLGILIPPSVPLIVYGVLVQESIAKLFVAAVIPGVIAMLGYMVVIKIVATRQMKDAPKVERADWGTRFASLLEVSPVVLVFVVVIYGIYGGWANLTEAASIAAAACGLYAVIRGGMRMKGLYQSILGTADATAMIYLVVLGADLLNSGLALSRMPVELAQWVSTSGLAPFVVLAAILVIYLLLGCVMDSLSMILLTIPIFYPVVAGLPFFDLTQSQVSIWFGIIALMVVEIGLITPPVGMNLFIVQKFSKNVSLGTVARGIVPFLYADLFRVVLLVAVPALTLMLLPAN